MISNSAAAKSSAPLVSVGMVMRNAASTIDLALRSITAQSYENWELLIIDDGSRDESLDKVRRVTDSRISVIADGQHRGSAFRLNQAVAAATGEFFARMDADDVAYPFRFERQLQFLLAHPEVDLVGSSVIVFRDGATAFGKRSAPPTHDEITAAPHSHFAISHSTWLGRVQWFRANPYSERARRAQDQILLLSSYEQSRFANLPEILLGYREDRISVVKCFRGRWSFLRSYMQRVGVRRPGAAALAVATHGGKFTLEAFAALSGLHHRILKHRARPLTAAEETAWKSVWMMLQNGMTDS